MGYPAPKTLLIVILSRVYDFTGQQTITDNGECLDGVLVSHSCIDFITSFDLPHSRGNEDRYVNFDKKQQHSVVVCGVIACAFLYYATS